MAPEMAGITSSGISERSDVYLVGAVLFEIATGAPPHANDMTNAVMTIAASPPRVPSDVAPELAAICTRAMQYDPNERYPSVAALRDDLQKFLMHRDSLHVLAEGTRLLSDLRSAIASDAPRRVLYDIWGECRFALRESLRTWPENTQAREGLRNAATALAEHELPRDPRVAAALLDEVAEPPSTLRTRVQSAVEADERERAKNKKLATELDPAVGWRTRSAVLVALGLVWTASALVGDRIGAHTHLRFLIGSALPIPLLLVFRFAIRDLGTTLFNRRMLSALLVLCVTHAALFAACWALRIDVEAARTLQLASALLIALMTAIMVDTRLWPMSVGLAAATAASVMSPALRPAATALAYFGVTINFAVVWRAHDKRR